MLLLIKGFSVLEAHAGRPAESVIDTDISKSIQESIFLNFSTSCKHHC